MFAGDHAAQVAGDAHDARHGRRGRLQHLVVVGIDRDVGVHVAIARVHVQGDEQATPQDLGVGGLAGGHDGRKGIPDEQFAQGSAAFALPGHPDGPVLQQVKNRRCGILRRKARCGQRPESAQVRQRLRHRRIHVVEQPLPAMTHAQQYLARLAGPLLDQIGRALRIGIRIGGAA